MHLWLTFTQRKQSPSRLLPLSLSASHASHDLLHQGLGCGKLLHLELKRLASARETVVVFDRRQQSPAVDPLPQVLKQRAVVLSLHPHAAEQNGQKAGAIDARVTGLGSRTVCVSEMPSVMKSWSMIIGTSSAMRLIATCTQSC